MSAEDIIHNFVSRRRQIDLESGLTDNDTIALECDKHVSEWLTDARNNELVQLYTYVIVEPLKNKIICGCNSLFDIVYQKAFVPKSETTEVWNLLTGDVFNFERIWGDQDA